MSLEELLNVPVYTASRFEQRASEAPSSITVITADEIRRSGWQTLGDCLRSVRGFYATYDRIYTYVGVRGFALPGDTNTKILFLVDGHRVNDELYNQGYVREDFILDLDLVDRIEIVRGPSSSLFGSNAFFGVVNVITRRPGDSGRVEADGELSSFGGRRGRVTLERSFSPNRSLVLSATEYDIRGEDLYFPEFDFPKMSDGIASGLDAERSHRYFGTYRQGDMTLEAAFVSREKRCPTSSYGSVFPDPAGRTQDEMYFVEARFERTRGTRSLLARVALDHYRFNSLNTIEDPEYNPVAPYLFILSDNGREETASAETKLTWQPGSRQRATVGAEYRGIFRQIQDTFVRQPFASIIDADRPSSIWAAYGQDEIRLGSTWLLNVGARFDHYSTSGGKFNPRAAIIWSPRPASNVKMIYGRAFRAPNAFELYWNDGGLTQKGNPHLEPETIQTHELALDQRLGRSAELVVTGYYYSMRNLVNLVTDPADSLDHFVNVGGVRAWGTEVELRQHWDSGWTGRIGGTLQRAEDDQSHERLPNSPALIVAANLAAPVVPNRLILGLEAQYVGAREPVRPAHASRAPDYAVANLTLTIPRLGSGVSLYSTIYNLFDRKYQDLGGAEHLQELLPREGRTWRLGLVYSR